MDEDLLKKLIYFATTVCVYNNRLLKCLEDLQKEFKERSCFKNEKKSEQKIEQ